MSPQGEPASPCVDICVLNEEDICAGCYRSAQEIAEWGQSDVSAKRRILENTLERRRRDGVLL